MPDTRTAIITMAEAPSSPLALLVWLSPAFPVGGFAFSHGLEWAVEAGDIHDAASLERWLTDLLEAGAIRSDAVLLANICRAPERAAELNELALALASSAERHLETSAQGTAFLSAVTAAWPTARLAEQANRFADAEIAYPIALGIAAAAHGLPALATIEAFLVATLGNLASAVLRLGPIGQSEAQVLLARLKPRAAALARWAEATSIEDIGTCAWRSDIAAMRHETQYSRLFRS